MQEHPQWQEETRHLADIRAIIAQMLTDKISKVRALTEEQSDINRDMWEDTRGFNDLEGITGFMQHIDQLKQNMSDARFNREEIERLDRLFLAPYFARIDFGMDAETPEPCYIGISTLMDDDTAKVLLYDWRAPISSLFYDSEPGPVHYKSPSGTVKGNMTLKRQYRLDGGKLVLIIDSGLAIHDGILQELLAAATGGKMRQIVTSIQKEQNKAIRFEDTRVLAVQGAAGSGKTSIAMHRAAYLLYRHRSSIKAENLVILSPNAILGEYIANVLPELGEESIKGTPFTTLADWHAELNDLKLETHAEMMESTLSAPNPIRQAGIAIKSTKGFTRHLEQFAESLNDKFPFYDITLNGEVLVAAKELDSLYRSDFRKMGIGRRLERIRLRVLEDLRQVERIRLKKRKQEIEEDDISLSDSEARIRGRADVRHELHQLREEVETRLKLDATDIYRRFLGEKKLSAALLSCCDEFIRKGTIPALQASGIPDGKALAAAIRRTTLARIADGTLPHEDLAPVLLLSLCTSLSQPDTKAKHVLVDEAQDYSAVQYAVFNRLFPHAGITLLGDINQNIRTDFAIGRLDDAAAILAPEDNLMLNLHRSYRCTLQIGRFSDAFHLSPVKTEHFGRTGDLPALLLTESDSAFIALLAEIVRNDKAAGYSSTALITRTQADAVVFQNLILRHGGLDGSAGSLVDEAYSKALEGILVIPSYLAKGLEFDHVVVIVDKAGEYAAPEELGLFHTVCSRALHRLAIVSRNGFPEVMKDVSTDLYHRA